MNKNWIYEDSNIKIDYFGEVKIIENDTKTEKVDKHTPIITIKGSLALNLKHIDKYRPFNKSYCHDILETKIKINESIIDFLKEANDNMLELKALEIKDMIKDGLTDEKQ